MTEFNSQPVLEAMLADIDQSYDPECLKMASVEEYVKDAVTQLYNKGYCKQQYWMNKVIGELEMNRDEKALEAATEIMELLNQCIPVSQLKARIQCTIVKVWRK